MKSDVAGIRRSIPEDLPRIRSWLADEERDGEGFIHNWNLIDEAHQDGQLTVYVDNNSQQPTAFLSYGLTLSSILQVQSQFKGRGIGRLLVEQALADAEAADEGVLVLQCAPKSSLAFWKRMGFLPYLDKGMGSSLYAYRTLERSFALEAGRECLEVVVRTYPESRLYSRGDDVRWLREQVVAAQRTDDGSLTLAKRLYLVDEVAQGDLAIEVIVAGRSVLLGKAKHPEAVEMGVRRTGSRQAWLLDAIKLPA